MIIRAPRPEQAFTQIRNDVLRDERLSYRARGVLAVILSRPDDWSTSAEALTRQGQEGRDAIRTALTELESAGYLTRERRQDSNGRWSTQAIVHDAPQSHAVQESLLPPTTDFQASENQPSVSQAISTNTEQEHSGPTDQRSAPADAPAPAQQVAKAVYEATNGMVNFLAVRAVASKALRMPSAPTVEDVTAALVMLYGNGRPLTATTLGQALNGGTRVANTHDAHWQNGGDFMPPSGK
jgi:hypothetical protein